MPSPLDRALRHFQHRETPIGDYRMTAAIGKTRMEAFSDGVIAILITIMVLELKLPHGGRT
jgi:Endosomal/lysosomal potassium channel TMEM175